MLNALRKQKESARGEGIIMYFYVIELHLCLTLFKEGSYL